jgi:hypothetical protein
MPKYPTGDKITVDGADSLADIEAIATPATATAEDCANKINAILALLQDVVE